MDNYNIGRRILIELKATWKTQEDLAKETGITMDSLAMYISGYRSPKAEDIVKIAKALHVTTDYLLGMDEPKLFDEKLKSVAAWITRNAKELTATQKAELAAAIGQSPDQQEGNSYLLNQLKLNPNIPIIPLISKEIDEACFTLDYDYIRIMGKSDKYFMSEYSIYNHHILVLKEYIEEFKEYLNERGARNINSIIKSLVWKKAIFVYVSVNHDGWYISLPEISDTL